MNYVKNIVRMVRLVPGFMALMLFSGTALAVKVPGPLVDSAWLAKHLNEVVVLDVRKDTKSFVMPPRFAVDKKTKKKKLASVGGHIPGSVLVDYGKIRSKQKVGGHEYQKMLPGKQAMEALIQAHGVNQDSAIIIVSKGQNNGDMTGATRLYWQLKYYGHDNMAILNGGVGQWINDRQKVTITPTKSARGNWKATAERHEILATSEDVARAMKDPSVQLVDNRPIAQYLGTYYKKSYVYAAGHIPGAKSFPNELLTKPSTPAQFLPVKTLSDLSKAMGINPNKQTITYCNSGHLATGGWFYMHEMLGNKNVKMFDGSMHQWTKEKRPVVTMRMD